MIYNIHVLKKIEQQLFHCYKFIDRMYEISVSKIQINTINQTTTLEYRLLLNTSQKK
jgi:hypothetical protein